MCLSAPGRGPGQGGTAGWATKPSRPDSAAKGWTEGRRPFTPGGLTDHADQALSAVTGTGASAGVATVTVIDTHSFVHTHMDVSFTWTEPYP